MTTSLILSMSAGHTTMYEVKVDVGTGENSVYEIINPACDLITATRLYNKLRAAGKYAVMGIARR